ncbi:MAG: ribosome recycling factor [Candidatus Peribacteraceae bacterium]|jgi:ribosome recycling factor|nr:ribosome recycling factor [Candidatus Peribacteraceae bacterium]
MADARIDSFNGELEKVLTYLHSEFAKLQTGQANAALIENVEVEAYGQNQPLKAVAGISVQDGRTIVVQPWDKAVMQEVEKALTKADIGVSPVNDGSVIRLNLPPMTEERRTQLTKVVSKLAEEARVSVRQQRDKLREDIKEEKDEDVRYTLLEDLDKAAAAGNDKIESSKKQKEEEVMTV